MDISDKLAIIAITVSVVILPLGSWLSYLYACRGFKTQIIESKTVQMYEAKNRLVSDLNTYGIIVRDLGQKAGMTFFKTNGGNLTTTDVIPGYARSCL